jgi:hypothetical protein
MKAPSNSPENPRPWLERLHEWWIGFLDGPNPPRNALLRQQQHTRRKIGTIGALATVLGLAGAVMVETCDSNGEPEKEVPGLIEEPEARKKGVEFFGQTIEIADQARFDAQVAKAHQHLILKFSIPGKVPDGKGDLRDETKDEYWKRAIEGDFRNVLIEMDRYRPLIETRAQALGVNTDILAFFGIEAGFDPLKKSPSGYCGLGQVGKEAVMDVTRETQATYKIETDTLLEKVDWYDLRYDQLYGIENGIAYIDHLKDDFPLTVQDLLRGNNPMKRWLESVIDEERKITRLDTMEAQLGIAPQKDEDFKVRYQGILKTILPTGDVKIADPGSFALYAYNMGQSGVARLVLLNFVQAKVQGGRFIDQRPGLITYFDV